MLKKIVKIVIVLFGIQVLGNIVCMTVALKNDWLANDINNYLKALGFKHKLYNRPL